MKIIKISTELEMTIHDFPEGTMREQNKVLCELIGNGCDIVEHVMPKRLYTMLKMSPTPTRTPGECVSMLIDEEGRLKPSSSVPTDLEYRLEELNRKKEELDSQQEKRYRASVADHELQQIRSSYSQQISDAARSMCEVWHGYREKSTIRSTDKRGN